MIQGATQGALAQGTTVRTCLELAAQLRARRPEIPLLFMGYLNPILTFGEAAFCQACRDAGVDGLIVPDLPPEEGSMIKELCRQERMALVYLLAPNTPPERMRLICERSRGYVYLVSVTGTTGARDSLPSDLAEAVGRVRDLTDKPIAVGFGISTPEQAAAVAQLADGIIVGSAVVRRRESETGPSDVKRFVAELRAAMARSQRSYGPRSVSWLGISTTVNRTSRTQSLRRQEVTALPRRTQEIAPRPESGPADRWACRPASESVPLTALRERWWEGETMKASQGLRGIAAVMILSLVAAPASLWADGSDDQGNWFGLRLSGGATGFPLTTANARLEAAVGLSDFSLAAWLELPYLPLVSATVGGDVTLSLDWLSVSARLSGKLALRQQSISFAGRASPPAWLLYVGIPSVLGGVTASATVTNSPQWGFDDNSLTLSPYVTAVHPVGEVLLSSTVELDTQIGPGDDPPRTSSSRLVSTLDAGSVVISNTLEFSGAFDALAAASVSLSLPQTGLTLTGSFLPSATVGGAGYRLSATYVFGNQNLLPFVSGTSGPICTGDTCFAP